MTLKKILIEGGAKLLGEVTVSGAKNSVLPLIAATLLAEGVSCIDDSPWLSDVDCMCRVLESLGASTCFDNGTLTVNTRKLSSSEPPGELVRLQRTQPGPAEGRLRGGKRGAEGIRAAGKRRHGTTREERRETG